MKKILILGGEGMLGHMLVKYLKTLPNFEVEYTTKKEFNVLEDYEKIEGWIKDVDLVVNCIGIINKNINNKNKREVAFVNSYFPHLLAEVCKIHKSKLIHISTDCVFNGKEGNYTEESKVSPTDFYGCSKAVGEVNDDYNLTIRTSLIGPEIQKQKTGLMEWLFEQKKIKGYTNVIWSGVTTLELAKQIVEMYEQKVTGLINIVSEPIDKFRLLCLIKKIYDLDVGIESDNKIKCDRSMKSLRYNLYKVPTHEEMLKELREFTNV